MKMKKIMIFYFAIALPGMVRAQLTNTSWKGQFNIPEPTQMILQFKTDTLCLNYLDNTPIETMGYKISNDTLTLHKLYGQSQCSYTKDATYKIFLKDSKLFITPINDDCSLRLDAWPSGGMVEIGSSDL